MRAIGVERHRDAVALQDAAQGQQDDRHTFAAVMEVGVEQLFGGVIYDGDQGEPPLGTRRQPVVAATIQMEQLSEAGPRLAPPAMAAAGPVAWDQARGLPGLLDEGVAEPHAVVAPRE